MAGKGAPEAEGDERVEEVLSGCGLFRHAEAFRRERVSWDALMELEEPDLVTLGLSLGPLPPARDPAPATEAWQGWQGGGRGQGRGE